MIQASELRLGNAVYKYFERKEIVFIKGIHEGEMAFEPIPLTSEILEACGFEKEGITSMSLIGFPCYFKIDKNNVECYGIHWIGKIIQIDCKYLHELQNLYFALTGTQLEVKLPVHA